MESSQPIKIVQLFECYPLFYQPYIPPVIKALQEIPRFNLHVQAFDGDSNPAHKVTIIKPNFSKKLSFKILRNKYKQWPGCSYIAYKSIQDGVDILHLQHSYLVPKITKLLDVPTNQRPKVIVTLRGGDTYIKPWISEKWRTFYKEYGTKIDAVITMSEHQKQYLNKWGVPMDKVHVIPISFGHRFEVSPKKVHPKKIKLIAVFRMTWEKNVDGNLRVIRELKRRNLPVSLDLYGDGPSGGQVHYLMEKYDIADCINFQGKIDNMELKKRLQKSDFLIQLSLSEAFPTTVLEAQSFGLPCIVSNNGGLPESIIQGESGYHVESDDIQAAANHIEELWKDPTKYSSFSKAAIQYSQSNYAIENEVSRLQSLYESLV